MKTMKCIRLASTAIAVSFAAGELFAAETAATPQPSATAGAASDKSYAPLAEARAKIGDVIADPEKMTEIMRTLSPEDQKSFVADVNAAIAKLPGSVEDKTAKYLNVNRAALNGVPAASKADILAVTFATVPPESLTVLSERYAVDLFSRDADPSRKVDDATFENIAKKVVGNVEQATTGSDDAGVRNTLAILMFLRASKGTPENLTDTLVDTMPDSKTRELARKEWIPAAMAEGDKKSYEAMLAYADAGLSPNIETVLALAGPQILDAVLLDITSGMNDSSGYQTTPILDQAFGGFDENRAYIHYDTTDPLVGPNPPVGPKPVEPKPYPYSNL